MWILSVAEILTTRLAACLRRVYGLDAGLAARHDKSVIMSRRAATPAQPGGGGGGDVTHALRRRGNKGTTPRTRTTTRNDANYDLMPWTPAGGGWGRRRRKRRTRGGQGGRTQGVAVGGEKREGQAKWREGGREGQSASYPTPSRLTSRPLQLFSPPRSAHSPPTRVLFPRPETISNPNMHFQLSD